MQKYTVKNLVQAYTENASPGSTAFTVNCVGKSLNLCNDATLTVESILHIIYKIYMINMTIIDSDIYDSNCRYCIYNQIDNYCEVKVHDSDLSYVLFNDNGRFFLARFYNGTMEISIL